MKTSRLLKPVRLPEHVKPIRYKITLRPDLEAFTFEGQTVIILDMQRAADEITLHSKELVIETAGFISKGSVAAARRIAWPRPQQREQRATRIQYDEKNETVTFKFEQNLPQGRGELRLVFRGVLNDNMRGFYRSRYVHEGREKYLATTQFEATDARRAFPCVDEPAAKAVFDVALIIPQNATAISNTLPVKISAYADGSKLVEFASTPPMSTYLLAFIVGDFEWLEARTKPASRSIPMGSAGPSVLVRVFTTPGKKHQAHFALQTAVKCLEFYNQYFAIPYPLPTLSLIAIPDFASGAMENWGAVTYRESALLVDEEKSSAANKQWVALVIAHELAHQWFGNLVTMEWWTDLWLNEGFASYIEYLAVNRLFPQWDIWTQYAYNDLGSALRLDALRTTHPIEVNVQHPDEIGEIFDEVSYSKGSAVIRMLADYLGAETFRDGLRYYLEKHSYANAATAQLWQAFEKVSGKPVRDMMRNWTGQPGYPLVSIKPAASGLLDEIHIEQSRFYSSPISRKQSKDRTLWQVPIKVQGAKRHGESYLLRSKQATIHFPKSAWIKINPGETGFYRVGYPEPMLTVLKRPIENKELAPIDRLGIIRDVFALAEAGQLRTAQALVLAISYKHEDDYNVWVELLAGLDLVNLLLFGQKGYAHFKTFVCSLLTSACRRVGWEKKSGEPHTTALLRSLILHGLGYYGDAETIQQAQKLFRRPQSLAPDLRGVVYSLVAENGGPREFQQFKALYLGEALHEEKNRLARGLAGFRTAELLGQALQFSLSRQVRPQDSPGLISGVWFNIYGRDMAWDFVKKNWKGLIQRYGEGGHMLPRLIKPAGLFITLEKAQEIRRFFKKHPTPGIVRTVTQVLERIESNAAWAARDRQNILNWLRDHIETIGE